VKPVAAKLEPRLSEVFRDRDPERAAERQSATYILASFAAEKPQADLFADLLMDADEKQFAILYPKWETHPRRTLSPMDAELAKSLPTDEDALEKRAKRQTNAAVILLKRGKTENVWPQLKHSDDPRVRSYLIHRLSLLGSDPKTLLKRLDDEKNPSIQRALLISLGGFGPDQLTAPERETWLPRFLNMYRNHPDPGIHGAVEWLLRQWNQQEQLQAIDCELAANGRADWDWYMNCEGHTMVILRPDEFWMGSPTNEPDRQGGPESTREMIHRRRIDRSYAVATKEVTVAQFLRFRAGHEYQKAYSRTADCPMNMVRWYDAVAYCNWLSDQEGLPRCYEPNTVKKYEAGMKMAPDYLQKTGYRLPTEAEWEYACRAGARTCRYYGETKELLGNYAWYTVNSDDRWLKPVGSLRPNDFGLFDMLGNVTEWCQNGFADYRPGTLERPSDDRDEAGELKLHRVLRGGSFIYRPAIVRCAYRFKFEASVDVNDVGFRIARTIGPDPSR